MFIYHPLSSVFLFHFVPFLLEWGSLHLGLLLQWECSLSYDKHSVTDPSAVPGSNIQKALTSHKKNKQWGNWVLITVWDSHDIKLTDAVVPRKAWGRFDAKCRRNWCYRMRSWRAPCMGSVLHPHLGKADLRVRLHPRQHSLWLQDRKQTKLLDCRFVGKWFLFCFLVLKQILQWNLDSSCTAWATQGCICLLHMNI